MNPNCRQHLNRLVALAMAALLTAPTTLLAQNAAAPTAGTPTLRILPLAGNNGVNDIEKQVMAPLAVQILNQNDLPVDGATVIFRFPISGPSATFADQQTSQTVRTNANGQARATGWSANTQVGTFAVQVTATRGTDQALATITMSNVPRILPAKEQPRKRWWTSKWAKIAYIGAAAGITTAIVVKNRSGNGDVTIQGTPGSPTIGGPQ
ncbi:MAG: hypothetical protein ABIR70_14380 [Bryobacteraceae bacterium]